MKKLVLVFAVFLVIFSGIFLIGKFFSVSPKEVAYSQAHSIFFDGKKISVDIVDTPETQRLGLSGRASLAPNHGMFFVFPQDSKIPIWMKDMHFSIDIIWLDKNLVVVDIAKNIAPETYPEIFYPIKDAHYVLEVPAGLSAIAGITVGEHAFLLP